MNKRTNFLQQLGVLEFISALNSDDPAAALDKLSQFNRIVRSERRFAVLGDDSSDGDTDGDGGTGVGGETSTEQPGYHADDDQANGHQPPKRQKLEPEWAEDLMNYQVPFVGTSVSKGATGQVKRNVWPTGFIEAYQKHSPLGVELIDNNHLSCAPPNGIHKSLFPKGEGSKAQTHRSQSGESRGQIISIALQTQYWTAVSEYLLGFASAGQLRREMGMDQELGTESSEPRCRIAPAAMTVMMKRRLPEWINAIHSYSQKHQSHELKLQKENQHLKKQRQKEQQQKDKKNAKTTAETQRQQVIKIEQKHRLMEEQHRREESLLVAVLRNLIALCHVSVGTAREVLRQITAVTDTKKSEKSPNKWTYDGSSWMSNLFSQKIGTYSSLEPQVECLRLICTLIEKRDAQILSRLTEVPLWMARNNASGQKKGLVDKNLGLAYVALRNGVQLLLGLRHKSKDHDEFQALAKVISRLLRAVRNSVIPRGGNAKIGRHDDTFADHAIDLFSGEVLRILTTLALLAPTSVATPESIQAIVVDENDSYDRLTPVQAAAVEGRRTLYVILIDVYRSPLLVRVHSHKEGQAARIQDQRDSCLRQLSAALHCLAGSEDKLSMMLIGVALTTTPRLVPTFLNGLKLGHTPESLSCAESIIRAAPTLTTSMIGSSPCSNEAISFLVPDGVTNNLWSKVLQSSSALTMTCGLKLIISISKRFEEFKGETQEHNQQVLDSTKEALMSRLPNANLLLSICPRFNPFSESSESNSIVLLEFCQALQCLIGVDPSYLSGVKFDWSRILPEYAIFFSVKPLLQTRIIETVMLTSSGVIQSFEAMIHNILSIMVETEESTVETAARKLASSLLHKELFPCCSDSDDAEAKYCREYEVSLWVDAVGQSTIQEFVQLMKEVKKSRLRTKIMISQVWSSVCGKITMPPLCTSFALLSSISHSLADTQSYSEAFSSLLVRVGMKLLSFQTDPRPLASVILHSVGGNGSDRKHGELNELIDLAKRSLSKDSPNKRCDEDIGKTLLRLRQAITMIKSTRCKSEKERLLESIRLDVSFLGSLALADSQPKPVKMTAANVLKLFRSNDITLDELKSMALILISSARDKLDRGDALTSARISIGDDKLRHAVEVLLTRLRNRHRDDDSTLKRLLYAILWPAISTKSWTNGEHLYVIMKSMLQTWSAIANGASDIDSDFSNHCEDCLLTMMDSVGDSRLALDSTLAGNVTSICLDSILQGQRVETRAKLLQSLATSDSTPFGKHLCEVFSDGITTGKYATCWEDGDLDGIAATFVLNCNEDVAVELIGFTKALSTIGERFLKLMISRLEHFGPRLLDVISNICSRNLLLEETKCVLLSILADVKSTRRVELDIGTMKLAIDVDSRLTANFTDQKPQLLPQVFLSCCRLIPKNLKRLIRSKKDIDTRHVDELLLVYFSSLVGAPLLQAQDEMNVIDGCLISCLKYGMMDPAGSASGATLGGCLKTIRVFLKLRAESKSQLDSSDLSAAQLHAMALSHSNFRSALGCGEVSGGETQQAELVKLLLCAVSIDSDRIRVEEETLSALLSVYSAGTKAVDQSIRRLLFCYEHKGCLANELCLSDLRWGSARRSSYNSDDLDEGWAWIVESLEINRVKATLSHFPVWDAYEPRFESSVEVLRLTKPSAHSDSGSESTDYSAQEVEETPGQSSELVADHSWRGTGDDVRYSPGFVLPLLLAALEADSFDLHEKTSDIDEGENNDGDVTMDDVKTDETSEHRRNYVTLCRKVFDKGGVALALASLSSRCPTLRKIAVSICGLFLWALQTKEANELKSWRERPQLAMLMSSVQRGLAVRRALQVQRVERDDCGIDLGGTDAYHHKIPLIPAVSAVFLARATRILSQPNDAMFSQLNRYFLRLSEFHGAFQDFFGLPTILSLYCSSADELSRSRVERSWALSLLKDGCVDEFCYKIIAQHHIPELLMSSFDTLIGQPESEREMCLTLDVLKTFITSAGSRASDLVCRQGILAWLYGIFSWRSVASAMPGQTMRIKYLNLIAAVVTSLRNLDKENNVVFYEQSSLTQVVAKVRDARCHDEEKEGEGVKLHGVADELIMLINSLQVELKI